MAVTASPTDVLHSGLAESEPGGEFSSRAAAEAYVGKVCFKQGPPLLIGAELEWLTAQGEPSASHSRPGLRALADALGPHAPRSISPDSPAVPLPGGSRVTLEPGGQIELSSAPFGTAAELCERLRADTIRLRELLESRGIRTFSAAADAGRRPLRVLQLPRYRAMERSFAGIGPFGALMMCNTAATQVSVDAGADPAEIAARWNVLYTMGPALLAAFACSPDLHSAPPGDWASQRMRAWQRLDQLRTRPPVRDWADPIAGYARWVLDVPLLCVRSRLPDGEAAAADWTAPPGATFADWLCGALDAEIGRRPDREDLDYHLTTVFPPVRAAGHLEVRYLDAQPGDGWTVPVHAFDALLSDPGIIAEAQGLAAPTAAAWSEAARHGLADPQLRATAVALLELATAHAATPEAAKELAAAADRCRSGRPPAQGEHESGVLS
ncbi:ergothioneine biosynthesis glutamate--cysteine ligase EgtA [Nocardia sp. CDC160]|uniref:ergothioneine biosynthesis glutamate--cysteine ligase EgtA n=1 Tax=Nocardia sp. CDC160 TaxID=3112166 RepID=UPI002DBCC245|nr:ergothioneine biosynthesis glutamate--cysteine ligase EgtA [Nocardia sp. CDC160]MEC3916945.1 ergothioneine biosynthesis glutamate--cysteine ligase EgtA [Nocardia sp. CDC160]